MLAEVERLSSSLNLTEAETEFERLSLVDADSEALMLAEVLALSDSD